MNKAYRYRLYPTREQKIIFAKTFGCARFIYNKMLRDRLDYYTKTGEKPVLMEKRNISQNGAVR